MNPNTDADPNYDDGTRPWATPRSYAPRMFELLGMEPTRLSRNQLEVCLLGWMANRSLFYDDGSGNTGFVYDSTMAELMLGVYAIDPEIESLTGGRFCLTENGGPSEWWRVITMVYNMWRQGRDSS
jgi:hypothetical protein